MVGDDQQVVDARGVHPCLQRALAARIFGVRKARVLLRQDRAQARRQVKHLARGGSGVVIDDQPFAAAVAIDQRVARRRQRCLSVAHLEEVVRAAVDRGVAKTRMLRSPSATRCVGRCGALR